jgi:hypothetical protein
MKAAIVTLAALLGTVSPAVAQDSCPPELAQAREALKAAQASEPQPRTLAGQRQQEVQAPRGQEVQAPRGQEVQAPREQEVQAPRGQEVQAPRGQEVQAPRGQEVQAPRGQDVQASPRGQEIQAPRAREHTAARTAIEESEAACKVGDMTKSATKAREALKLLGR